jgi:uncharacterized protein (UPF0261 family)
MPTVLIVGTLDTKGDELGFAAQRMRDAGVDVLVADAGTAGPPHGLEPDISAAELAAEVGADLAALDDRGKAVGTMADAAAALAARLHGEGRIDGVFGAGGSGNTTIATAAMRALPVGVPKLVVSTLTAGDTAVYVGGSDITMMASVTDVAGLNSISARILANAAAAIAGMVGAPPVDLGETRPLIGATMFGVTTPCVTRAREQLEAAGAAGLPQVVSLGALDMVNFGARDTVPPQFEDRTLYVHNPTITLMRTTKEECAELGRRIARKLSAAKGPVALYIPLGGVSAIDVPGAPFHDAEADAALFDALRSGLSDNVELVEREEDINAEAFADAMVEQLDAYVKGSG